MLFQYFVQLVIPNIFKLPHYQFDLKRLFKQSFIKTKAKNVLWKHMLYMVAGYTKLLFSVLLIIAPILRNQIRRRRMLMHRSHLK